MKAMQKKSTATNYNIQPSPSPPFGQPKTVREGGYLGKDICVERLKWRDSLTLAETLAASHVSLMYPQQESQFHVHKQCIY